MKTIDVYRRIGAIGVIASNGIFSDFAYGHFINMAALNQC